MQKVTINGHITNFRQAGQGEDLILIHGLAANHAFWNLMLLLPLARKFRVTVYDLRGHGYSEMPPDGYTTRNMTRDLIALMDHLGIEKAHLVGHSFGGVIALHTAVEDPDRVCSLSLADSRVRALQPSQRLRDWPNWREAQRTLEQHGICIDENAEDCGLLLLEKLAAPQWREARASMSKKALFLPFGGWSNGNRSAEKWLRLLQTTTARRDVLDPSGLTLDRIRTVQHKTLAIYGEHSRCMKTCDELQKTLPQCTRVIVPEVGHFYPVIKPAFVADRLLEFLTTVPAEAPKVAERSSDDGEEACAA